MFPTIYTKKRGKPQTVLAKEPPRVWPRRRVDIDGPEYETVGAVSCMGIFAPHFVMEYNWYCD